MRTAAAWFALAMLVVTGGRVAAQTSPAGDNLRIYVATYGQGDEVWELFGHNAIWVQDANSGLTLSYNWGMFSFSQPGFVARLVRGSMLYWMQPQNAQEEADGYVRRNRSITVQELELTPAQKIALREFLHWNDTDENRFYEYHYYRDNCSTRVRDAIDRVLGGQLGAQLRAIKTDQTFRSRSLELTAGAPLAYTGIELGLADSVDHKLSAYEEAFVPMELMRHLRAAQVTAADGTKRPLVRAENAVFTSSRPAPPERVPLRWPIYLLIGAFAGGVFFLLGRGSERSGAARWGFAVATVVWCVITGVFGLFVLLLWTSTGHTFTYGNENLFQVNPVLFVLAILAPAAGFRARWAVKAAFVVAAVLAALSVLGLLLKVLPGFDQWNRDIVALMLPAHLGLAAALYRLKDGNTSRVSDDG